MSIESLTPVCIVCAPSSEVATVVQGRVEQLKIPFCIIPVGSHYAHPQLPEYPRAAIVALCTELLSANPVELLCQLKQKGARLLPLAQNDARAMWDALTARVGSEVSELAVYQLDEEWEKALSCERKSTLAHYQVSPRTIVNRDTPSLRIPLADLNAPEPLQSELTSTFAAQKPERRALVWWLYFLLSISVVIFVVSLWQLCFGAKMRSVQPQADGVRLAPPLNPPDADAVTTDGAVDSTLAQPVNTADEAGETTYPAQPAPMDSKKVENNAAHPQIQDADSSHTLSADSIFNSGASTSAPEPPAYTDKSQQDVSVSIPAYHEDDETLTAAVVRSSSETPSDVPTHQTPEQVEEKTPATPRTVQKKTPKARVDKPAEKTVATSTPPQTSKPHYCPTDAEVRKARLGSKTGRYIEAGAAAGCTRCRSNLEHLKKR